MECATELQDKPQMNVQRWKAALGIVQTHTMWEGWLPGMLAGAGPPFGLPAVLSA